MKNHFNTIDEAEPVAYYFMHDIVSNIKAMHVLWNQYELKSIAEKHETAFVETVSSAVIELEKHL